MVTISLLGNWTGNRAYGYSKLDHGILTSEKGVAKIKRLFKAPHNLNLSFIRTYGASKLVEEGEKTTEFVKEETGEDVEFDEEAFNVAFCQNTGAEKIPMTAWCIAHRIGHSVRESWSFRKFFIYLKRIMIEVSGMYGIVCLYEHQTFFNDRFDNRHKAMRYFAYNIGTMRSCREYNLAFTNEFAHELIAQYLICGAIKFRKMTDTIVVDRRFNWGREWKSYKRLSTGTVEQVNDELTSAANIMNDMLYYAFENMVGTLVVM